MHLMKVQRPDHMKMLARADYGKIAKWKGMGKRVYTSIADSMMADQRGNWGETYDYNSETL